MIFGVMTIVATGSPQDDAIVIPPNPIRLVERSQDPRCTCDLAKGVYIQNHGDRRRVAYFRFDQRNTLSGEEISGEDFRVLTAKMGQTPGEAPLACTIEETGTLGCVLENRFYLRRNAVVSEQQLLSAFGVGAQLPSLEMCRALCTSGNPACLTLGSAFAKITIPISELYSQATNNGASSISRQEVMAAYGLSADDDKCERTNVDLDPDDRTFLNTSTLSKGCEILAFDDLQGLMNLSSADLDGMSDVSLFIPSEVYGEVVPSLTVSGNNEGVVTFPERDRGPHLNFGGNTFRQQNYGGQIISSYREGNLLVMQTSNGCMASRFAQ